MVKRALLAVVLAIAGISFLHAEDLAQPETLSVPAGTIIHCRTNQTLTTKLNVQGDAFTISVAEPVTINGSVAIPAGATLAGHITLMERPGRIKGVGQMRLAVEQITFPDGHSLPLGATLMTAYGVDNVKVVGNEGLVKGPSSRFADFEEIGGGTAGGILVGLMFAHPVVGATVGLAATTVDRLRRRGKDLTIPAGTELNYQLTRELPLAPGPTQASTAEGARPGGK
jgi:hypothetical protein